LKTFFHQSKRSTNFKAKKQINLGLDNSKGSNYMTQLERVLNEYNNQQIRHSTKGGTQIEPKEWH